MVRELDLKKPPSIAESIDWARALLLLGADDIDADVFRETMSIIVKHRTDLDTVAERVGVQLWRRSMPPAPSTAGLPDGAAARLRRGAARRGRGDRHLRADRRVRRARRGRLDRARATFREALAATLAKSPEDRRVFDLVFERFFFRAAEAAALEPRRARGRRARASRTA